LRPWRTNSDSAQETGLDTFRLKPSLIREALVLQQMFDVVSSAAEKVIDTEHLAALLEQSFAEVRAQKACPTGNENSSL